MVGVGFLFGLIWLDIGRIVALCLFIFLQEVFLCMAKCDVCGKAISFGIKVSHSHRRSNRSWKPNVRRVKALVNGSPCHMYACSRCLRSGKVERV